MKEQPLPEDKAKQLPPLDVLKQTEWCGEFEQLMRNRMIMGAFRYGRLADQNFEGYDLVGEIKKRITKFETDGNLEHFVDAGNIAMIAYYHGKSKGFKMIAQDDSEHAEYKLQ